MPRASSVSKRIAHALPTFVLLAAWILFLECFEEINFAYFLSTISASHGVIPIFSENVHFTVEYVTINQYNGPFCFLFLEFTAFPWRWVPCNDQPTLPTIGPTPLL